MKTAKRITTILALVAITAIALIGPASTAGAIKGERPGTVTVALRAPKGYQVHFTGSAGEFTMTGNQQEAFDMAGVAIVEAEPVATKTSGPRPVVELDRVNVTHGAAFTFDPATGRACIEVPGNGNLIIRFVYR